ncbi:CLUMA_CG010032, isoform A [Clunio marinus]|uniref:Apolipoprotein D n=1 Tax=Clunio marinus TaxID=568069 RepID=A0A1J1ICJ7_9DIPT|nr:CLUMA_CG010032, isoform A [Clunio marinus]
MKYLIIVVALALFGGALALEFDRPCRLDEQSPRVKRDFQVVTYMGVWYEIRRYEAANQTDFDCTMARYSLNADGSVQVANSGYTAGGQFIEFIGRGVLASPNDNPLLAKLEVQFVPQQPPSILWILATDYVNYSIAWSCSNLPGGRSNEAAWVLSRTPTTSEAVRIRYEQVLQETGIFLDEMRETNQNLEFCRLPIGKMKYLIIISLALFGAILAREYDRPCRLDEMSARVKTGFQVPTFLGVWYEVRRYEAQNQIGFDCAMAPYSLNADGSVQVINSGYSPQGQFIEFIGRADLTFPDSNPLVGKLDVQFVPGQPTSIYWTLATNYADYAVIWSCRPLPGNRSNEAAWVLSRTPQTSDAVRFRYEEILRANDIVLEEMRETNQDLEFCQSPRA